MQSRSLQLKNSRLMLTFSHTGKLHVYKGKSNSYTVQVNVNIVDMLRTLFSVFGIYVH